MIELQKSKALDVCCRSPLTTRLDCAEGRGGAEGQICSVEGGGFTRRARHVSRVPLVDVVSHPSLVWAGLEVAVGCSGRLSGHQSNSARREIL